MSNTIVNKEKYLYWERKLEEIMGCNRNKIYIFSK